MGIEHERIHLETSSVLIRQLPVDMVTKPKGWVYSPVKCGKVAAGHCKPINYCSPAGLFCKVLDGFNIVNDSHPKLVVSFVHRCIFE